jgi:integrase
MVTDSSHARASTVTVRIFGSLRPLRTERRLPCTLTVEVPPGGIAARDLAVSLELPPEKIEGVFVNHVVHGIGVHVSPGDRVAFVPYGTPGPHRVFLGLYAAGEEERDAAEGCRDASGKRRQIFRDAGTKKEARQILQQLLRELDDGTFVEPSATTLAEYLPTWLEDIARHRVTRRTYDRYECIVRLQLVPAFGGIKLTALRPDQVQRLYSQLIDAGLSASTVQKVHAVLHSSLKHAVRMCQISRNPSDDMALPKIRRREMTALSEEQIGKLLAAAEGTSVAVPLLCLVTLGVRRGELLGLRWPDVDFEASQVSVRRTLEESSAGVTLKEPKTARASRTIALPQITAAALREHRKAQYEMRLRVGPSFNSHDLVFPGADGEPWWGSNFAHVCRRVFKAAGISCRIHDLRHTHATMLLRQGVHPKVVQERLGHANVGIILDIYSHVPPHMQSDAAEKIDAGMRKALAG